MNAELPTITYVSLFAGIEAMSMSASRIAGVNWKPVFFSEIEPFPCAVLAHHFPDVPNLGDVTKIHIDAERNIATNESGTAVPLPDGGIDILAGGSPCQDVSNAGKRRGMSESSDTRSSLAFTYARLVGELRPKCILWENVPGVLSSNRGLDFAAFLDRLGQLGYRRMAFRVLDAQFTRTHSFPAAIPQRRRRVFVVAFRDGVRAFGHSGADDNLAVKVLFERARELGNTPPRREPGHGFAAPSGVGPARNDRVVAASGFDLLAFGKYGGGGLRQHVEDARLQGCHRPCSLTGADDQEVFSQRWRVSRQRN